jgi:hypothetical protein
LSEASSLTQRSGSSDLAPDAGEGGGLPRYHVREAGEADCKVGFARVPERFNRRPFNALVRELAESGPEIFDRSAWHITLAAWDVF